MVYTFPPIYLDADIDKTDKGEITPNEENDSTSIEQVAVLEQVEETLSNEELYLEALNHQAQEHLFLKLGNKISHQIDEEIESAIVPHLELVLEQLYDQLGEERSQYLIISEGPSSGYGERIFNLYDTVQKQNIATFHVNRVKRPQSGYYFQFHYHLQQDNFEEHYPIGDVYWGEKIHPPQDGCPRRSNKRCLL